MPSNAFAEPIFAAKSTSGNPLVLPVRCMVLHIKTDKHHNKTNEPSIINVYNVAGARRMVNMILVTACGLELELSNWRALANEMALAMRLLSVFGPSRGPCPPNTKSDNRDKTRIGVVSRAALGFPNSRIATSFDCKNGDVNDSK